MKIEINKKNSNSIDNPTYLIKNPHLLIVDDTRRYLPRKHVAYDPQPKFAKHIQTAQKFGISKDSPFDSQHT